MSASRSCDQARLRPLLKKEESQMVSACVTVLSLCLLGVGCSPHILSLPRRSEGSAEMEPEQAIDPAERGERIHGAAGINSHSVTLCTINGRECRTSMFVFRLSRREGSRASSCRRRFPTAASRVSQTDTYLYPIRFARLRTDHTAPETI